MIKKKEMEDGIRKAIVILQSCVGDIVVQPKYVHTGVKAKVLDSLRQSPSTVGKLSASLKLNKQQVNNALYQLKQDGVIVNEYGMWIAI